MPTESSAEIEEELRKVLDDDADYRNEVNDVDDEGDSDMEAGEGGGAGTSRSDEWDMCSPAIFNSKEGARRFFVVAKTLRITGNFRPSFVFSGYVAQVPRDQDFDGAASQHTVVEDGLTLSLRYEPPSPKFSRKCPGGTSYRLKLLHGSEFLYSTRGLNKRLLVDKGKGLAKWGSLELVFREEGALVAFLDALKYVDVVEASSKGLQEGQDVKKDVQPWLDINVSVVLVVLGVAVVLGLGLRWRSRRG